MDAQLWCPSVLITVALCSVTFTLFSFVYYRIQQKAAKLDTHVYDDPVQFVIKDNLESLSNAQLRELLQLLKPVVASNRKEIRELKTQYNEDQRVQQEIVVQLRSTITNLTQQNATLHKQNNILNQRMQGQIDSSSSSDEGSPCSTPSSGPQLKLLVRRAKSMPQLSPLNTEHDTSKDKGRKKSPLRLKTALTDLRAKSPKLTPKLIEEMWSLQEQEPNSPGRVCTVKFSDIVQCKDDDQDSLRPISDLKVKLNRMERWNGSPRKVTRTKRTVTDEKDAMETLREEFNCILRWKNLTKFIANDPLLHQARTRRNLCVEFYTMENLYVDSLKTTIESYMDPLACTTILMKEDSAAIFGTIKPIIKIHSEFLSLLSQEMLDDPGRARIGYVCQQVVPFLLIYQEYLNHFDTACEVYETCMATHKRFVEFIERTNQKTGTDLMSLLIQPLKRIERYQALLTSLLKYTPQDHIDFEHLKQVTESITELASTLKRRKHQLENDRVLAKLRVLQPSLIDGIIGTERPIQRTEFAKAIVQTKHASRVTKLCDGNVIVCLFHDALLLIDENDNNFYVMHFSFVKIVEYSNTLRLECIFRGDTLEIELKMENDHEEWIELVLNNVEKCKKSACKRVELSERELDDLIRKELLLVRGHPRLIYEVSQIRDKKEEMAKGAQVALERLKKDEATLLELSKEIEKLRLEREEYIMELHHLTSVHEQCVKDLQLKQNEKGTYDETLMTILDSKYFFDLLFTSVEEEAEILDTPLSV